MIELNLFLASSIHEFERERNKFGAEIQKINQEIEKDGHYIYLYVCEDESKEIVKGRKQEEYNKKIRKADYFFLLAGASVGEYTLEELACAIEAYQNNGTPEIYIFLLRQDVPTDSSIESLKKMMGSMDSIQVIYYSEFDQVIEVLKDVIGKRMR